MIVLDSARKHGITEREMRKVITDAVVVVKLRDEPSKYMFFGFDLQSPLVFMRKFRIITNNPLVRDEYPEFSEFVDAGVGDVLLKARDYIHRGARLVNHPQSGSLSPGVSPYGSIVIQELDEYAPITTDYYSLTLIENAIEQFAKSPKSIKEYNESTLEDFKVVDLDLLKNAVKN